jgi:hypothetical protein
MVEEELALTCGQQELLMQSASNTADDSNRILNVHCCVWSAWTPLMEMIQIAFNDEDTYEKQSRYPLENNRTPSRTCDFFSTRKRHETDKTTM